MCRHENRKEVLMQQRLVLMCGMASGVVEDEHRAPASYILAFDLLDDLPDEGPELLLVGRFAFHKDWLV